MSLYSSVLMMSIQKSTRSTLSLATLHNSKISWSLIFASNPRVIIITANESRNQGKCSSVIAQTRLESNEHTVLTVIFCFNFFGPYADFFLTPKFSSLHRILLHFYTIERCIKSLKYFTISTRCTPIVRVNRFA